MFDCNNDMTEFQDNHVRLTDAQSKQLTEHRTANRKRLESGLSRDGKPPVHRFVLQGSKEMETINQHPEYDYDLDDGAAFLMSKLVKPDGSAMSPAEARDMVRDAVQDGAFDKKPEVRANCVRVYFSLGYHIDIPVYRIRDPNRPGVLELASGDAWKAAAPEEVTSWFARINDLKSPDTSNGRQFRRIVRLLKQFTRSRKSWRLPSGLTISKLCEETYQPHAGRDDEALARVMDAIHRRLCGSLTVRHPVLQEDITKSATDQAMIDLRDRLKDAVDDLRALYDLRCTRLQALESWKKVFNHRYWDDAVDRESAAEKDRARRSSVANNLLRRDQVPAEPVRKGGGNGYA